MATEGVKRSAPVKIEDLQDIPPKKGDQNPVTGVHNTDKESATAKSRHGSTTSVDSDQGGKTTWDGRDRRKAQEPISEDRRKTGSAEVSFDKESVAQEFIKQIFPPRVPNTTGKNRSENLLHWLTTKKPPHGHEGQVAANVLKDYFQVTKNNDGKLVTSFHTIPQSAKDYDKISEALNTLDAKGKVNTSVQEFYKKHISQSEAAQVQQESARHQGATTEAQAADRAARAKIDGEKPSDAQSKFQRACAMEKLPSDLPGVNKTIAAREQAQAAYIAELADANHMFIRAESKAYAHTQNARKLNDSASEAVNTFIGRFFGKRSAHGATQDQTDRTAKAENKQEDTLHKLLTEIKPAKDIAITVIRSRQAALFAAASETQQKEWKNADGVSIDTDEITAASREQVEGIIFNLFKQVADSAEKTVKTGMKLNLSSIEVQARNTTESTINESGPAREIAQAREQMIQDHQDFQTAVRNNIRSRAEFLLGKGAHTDTLMEKVQQEQINQARVIQKSCDDATRENISNLAKKTALELTREAKEMRGIFTKMADLTPNAIKELFNMQGKDANKAEGMGEKFNQYKLKITTCCTIIADNHVQSANAERERLLAINKYENVKTDEEIYASVQNTVNAFIQQIETPDQVATTFLNQMPKTPSRLGTLLKPFRDPLSAAKNMLAAAAVIGGIAIGIAILTGASIVLAPFLLPALAIAAPIIGGAILVPAWSRHFADRAVIKDNHDAMKREIQTITDDVKDMAAKAAGLACIAYNISVPIEP